MNEGSSYYGDIVLENNRPVEISYYSQGFDGAYSKRLLYTFEYDKNGNKTDSKLYQVSDGDRFLVSALEIEYDNKKNPYRNLNFVEFHNSGHMAKNNSVTKRQYDGGTAALEVDSEYEYQRGYPISEKTITEQANYKQTFEKEFSYY